MPNLTSAAASHQSVSETPLVIESCHSTWLFDEANHRFRRVVKGLDGSLPVMTDWRHYNHLVLGEESDAFLVFLDDAQTRVLRSRRHVTPGCDRCSENATSELSIREIAEFAMSSGAFVGAPAFSH